MGQEMQKEAALEHVSLTKRGLLEYLGAQRAPVTAKVASIDLDSRASTVTEMLERCVAQGLAERATDQRPREYKLSDEGRRRLDLFSSKERVQTTRAIHDVFLHQRS
jgi:DNA-binding MarR family transcriptional regulator